MHDSYIRFDQEIVLTKDQFELLNIISKAHDKSISECIQKAVIETMKNEIEFRLFPSSMHSSTGHAAFRSCSFRI